MRRSRALMLVTALAVAVPVLVAAPASAKSAAVAAAQRRLNALHCNAGPVDGRQGTWTRSGVIRFQSRHALRQSGRFDVPTRKKLWAATAQRCDLRPLPAGSGSGRRIVLSQPQNWIWLVDARGQVVAQGGIVDNPAILHRGTFRTGSYCGRSARVVKNHSGSLWLDHFVRFAPCGFGFHRIPRAMSSGRQIHPDRYLGTNLAQSHGCIRLSAAMAKRVWDFTAAGRTTVRVL